MTSSTHGTPEDLRHRMVTHIAEAGHLHSPRIEQAMRTVPRHRFVPDASIQDAYANKAITIKPGDTRPAICASVPTVVAMMLDQLNPRPGDHILEIGAGTGYNAALLAELVGPTGQVTTMDIHDDVTDHARTALAATGYPQVRVLTGDGAHGAPDHAPFNKIIVTVGPWDLPPAWYDQLTPAGTLVVPLHWRGQARSIAFTKHDNHLRATNSQLCGFIPMIGIVPTGEHTTTLTNGVDLHWDTDQNINPDTLRPAFTPNTTTDTLWSGVTATATEPLDHIWLWLTATEPSTCRLAATDTAINNGTCHPIFADRTPAITDHNSIAYLANPRRTELDGEPRYELSATGHGPNATNLAHRLITQIHRWDHDRTAQPTITAHPAHLTNKQPPNHSLTITKHHTRMTFDIE